jgi:hypothetical protein
MRQTILSAFAIAFLSQFAPAVALRQPGGPEPELLDPPQQLVAVGPGQAQVERGQVGTVGVEERSRR